ncbi:ATP-binding protein [Azospirillum doebereinerae]
MADETFLLEVQDDFLARHAKVPPVQAISELIWNALDAEATRVDVSWDSDDLGGIRSIRVSDNGHGIPREEVQLLFRKLGGSWKQRGAKSKTGKRWLHGHNGQGRLRAFALGRCVEWKVVYIKESVPHSYTVLMLGNDKRCVRLSDEKPAHGSKSGVEVTITEVNQNRFLERDSSRHELTEIFAIYLKTYRDVVLSISSLRLNPADVIASEKSFPLGDIDIHGEIHTFRLDIIEWRGRPDEERRMFLCDQNGLPRDRRPITYSTFGYHFSAYLRSEYIAKLDDENALGLVEMEAPLVPLFEQVKNQIKGYFRDRAAIDAGGVVEAWKAERVYPFNDLPQTPWEDAERKVFDIVAVRVNEALPELATGPKKNRAFQLRMLKQAIERSPEDLQYILTEVLNLPDYVRRDMRDLLRRTTLQSIIGATKIVGDRIEFLNDLDAMLFGKLSRYILERTQLHRILADNTWIFGEEFHLTVDDQSLTEVLRNHQRLLGEKIVIDEPVAVPGQTRGIVDLMFSKVIQTNRSDEIQHLVVELKRPKKIIDSAEITQIERYAQAVAADHRFQNINVKWDFWIIGTKLSQFAEEKSRQQDMPPGVTWRSKNGRLTTWCKSWAEIIQENRGRLRFFEEKFNYRVDRGSNLDYIRKKYEELLKNIPFDTKNINDQLVDAEDDIE